ncbi:hypothetical protein [Methanoculleus bourgensis]|jgi:uncharacterized protein YwgA|uniref:hypothetical protein n=1 Tax=Methanoculleus bourgensis TaxID=83986 RepID=UPI002491BBD4|nr:hypothetical protein [Methanoculleus bourgensis]
MSTNYELLEDGTKLYSFKEFTKLLADAKQSKKRKVLISDLILVLLYAHPEKPIFGRTMLIKQAFLLFEEVLSSAELEVQNPKFVPHNYGPYSFTVMQIVEDLWFSRCINVSGRKNSRKESFKLTKEGMNRAAEAFNKLNQEVQQDIRNKRVGWDQLGTDGILRYVYENYPDMKVNSKIKNRYEEIVWGN